MRVVGAQLVRRRYRPDASRPATPGTMLEMLVLFFFQAEDGIRDVAVTGVQTCALPILLSDLPPQHNWHADCAEVVRSNLIIRRHIPIALPSAVIDAVDQDGIGRFVPAEQAVAGSCGTANPG